MMSFVTMSSQTSNPPQALRFLGKTKINALDEIQYFPRMFQNPHASDIL